MSVASSDVCEGESAAGALLADLERRQDDVLAQLDVLDQQLSGILRGLGVTLVDEAEATGPKPDMQRGDDETVNPVSSSPPPGATTAGVTPAAASGERALAPEAAGFAKLPSDQPLAAAGQPRAA